MKNLSFFALAIIFSFSAGTALAQVQYRTDSNSVITKVGNPIENANSCPISGGKVTCGSKNVPVNGCGHCGIGYEQYMSNCTYEGINYAIDIAGAENAPIILPSVNGKSIAWTFASETNSTGNQAIQQYGGTDITTGEKYWIQFHHTAPGSGRIGTHLSGDTGANICDNGCNMGHVHVEFAKVDASGKNIWQDGPTYFCK